MYDVIILGSGPTGLTAAIYTTRASLKTLVIAGEKWGGQLMLTTEVDNFPGFPDGIQGPDLMNNMRKQAERFGAEFVDENFTRLLTPEPARQSPDGSSQMADGRSDGGQEQGLLKSPFAIQAADKTYEGKSVIIATGADTKWLDIPGEKEKIGRGVSSCAPCDAPFFRGKKVIVAGGGDSAMEEACVLTRFADEVTIVHRRSEFRASQIMIDKAKANPKIKFVLNSQIAEIVGDQKVTAVKIKNLETNEEKEMPIDGVFVAIGHIPNSSSFKGIEADEKGFIKVHEHTRTNIEGVFVAGDVHDRQYMQAITAAGFGCAAALEAERWIESKKE